MAALKEQHKDRAKGHAAWERHLEILPKYYASMTSSAAVDGQRLPQYKAWYQALPLFIRLGFGAVGTIACLWIIGFFLHYTASREQIEYDVRRFVAGEATRKNDRRRAVEDAIDQQRRR